VREEVKFDAPSSENGVPAVELVGATIEAKAFVERHSVTHGAARQYWYRKIVWLRGHDHGHWGFGIGYWGLRRLTIIRRNLSFLETCQFRLFWQEFRLCWRRVRLFQGHPQWFGVH